MIIINDSNSAKDNPISFVSKNVAGMVSEYAGGSPKDCSCVVIRGRLTSEGNPRDSDWGTRGWVQYCVRITFLKSTIARLHVFFNEVAVPPKVGTLVG